MNILLYMVFVSELYHAVRRTRVKVHTCILGKCCEVFLSLLLPYNNDICMVQDIPGVLSSEISSYSQEI